MSVADAGGAVVVITGAASGIGRVCADHLAAAGYRVFGGDIRVEARSQADRMVLGPLDVNDDESCRAFVAEVAKEAGRIDVLFNNAGFGIAGPAEETSSTEAHAQFETNFFGVTRMCREVLPVMRDQGSGLIVNMSSIGGLIAMPFQALYSAAKFAVEGYSEALMLEVEPFGVDVVLVEPSDFRTGFTDRRRLVAGHGDGSPYRRRFRQVLGTVEKDERTGSDPEQVARLLQRIIEKSRRRPRYTVGSPVIRVTPLIKRVVPGGVARAVMRSYWGRS